MGAALNPLGGRYELERLLLEDEVKQVWVARDLRLERTVTVELVRAELAELRSRFTMRARLLAANSHPSLVTVYDTGWQDGMPYAVLEALSGTTLAERLRHGPPALASQVIELGLALTTAVAVALQRDLDVWDLAPENVVLLDEQHLKLTNILLRNGRLEEAAPDESVLVSRIATFLTAFALPGGTIALDRALRPEMLPVSLPVALRSILLAAMAERGASLRTVVDLRQALAEYRLAAGGATRSYVPVGGTGREQLAAEDGTEAVPVTRTMPIGAGAVGLRGSPPVRRRQQGGGGFVLLWLVALLILVGAGAIAYWMNFADAATITQRALAIRISTPKPEPTKPSIAQIVPLFTPTPSGVAPTPTPGTQGEIGGVAATPTIDPVQATATAEVAQTAAAAAATSTAGAVLTVTATAGVDQTATAAATVTAEAILTATATVQPTDTPVPPTATPVPMQMVPNVVGMPLSTAVQTLAEGGFAISREPDQPSATVAAGSVMIQVPQAGAMVPPGTEVFLVVSSGPPGVRVPKVVGLIQANATETLHNSGLVARVEQQRSATVPNGVVIAQIPDAGTVVQPGTVVKIVVSAGNLISVPNVIGMTEAEAQRAIQAAGLATTYPNLSGHSPSVQIGQVESETPSAGTLVPPGTTVYINVRSS